MAVITPYWSLDVFLCISSFAVGCYAYLTRNFNYWKNLGIKCLPPSFPFGNVGACILGKKSPQQFVNDAYRTGTGEKLLGFYAIDRPYLLVRDPQLVKHVLIRDFHNFTNKLFAGNDYDELGNKNIFMTDATLWRYLRPKFSPLFTSTKLKRMFDLMLETAKDLWSYCDDLEIDDKIGKPIEVREVCAKFATDFIGTAILGMKLNSLTKKKSEFRSRGRQMLRSTYKRYLGVLSIFFLPTLRRFTRPKLFDDENSGFFKEAFRRVIDERMRTGDKRNDLIDILIEMKENNRFDGPDGFELEGDTLIAQAAAFFAGGTDTPSSTMAYALYELAKNPEMQNRLRSEVQSAIEKEEGKITLSLVSTLPYLNMVTSETLRMYPILGWLDRVPESDYAFPGTGVTVKKGVPCIISVLGLQMDPEYFPNPETFEPERFSNENKSDIVPGTYLPFGDGPRNCIGKQLGLLMVKLSLIYFITRYEITTCKQTPLPMIFSTVNVLLRPADGLFLNFRELPKHI